MKKILSTCMVLMIGGAVLTGPGCADKKAEEASKDALALLKEGNGRFVAMAMEHPGENAERREETSVNGQKPFAAVLGCADSRVPVEMIFDRGIGDIFVVRVAGNIAAGSSVTGSLEYAVWNLQVPLLVILGHTQCGAVGAAVSGAKLVGDVRDIQRRIEPVAEEIKVEYPDLEGEALINEVAKRNVLQVEENLLSGSEEIRNRVAKGELKIVPAFYNIETGKVDWFDKE